MKMKKDFADDLTSSLLGALSMTKSDHCVINRFLNKNASSADESSAKVLFKHPSTTFVYTKT